MRSQVCIEPTDNINFLAECAIASGSSVYETVEDSKEAIKTKLVQGFECYEDGVLGGCSFISKLSFPCVELYTIDGFRVDAMGTSLRGSIESGKMTREYAKKELGIDWTFIVHPLNNVGVNRLSKLMGYKNTCIVELDGVHYMLLVESGYYKRFILKQ